LALVKYKGLVDPKIESRALIAYIIQHGVILDSEGVACFNVAYCGNVRTKKLEKALENS
jgi:hypothetical protein